MDNQHRKIAGYRELTAEDIELMNQCKAAESNALTLVNNIDHYLDQQLRIAMTADDTEELNRQAVAQPHRWTALAKTNIQHAFMDLVRAIAQPGPYKPTQKPD